MLLTVAEVSLVSRNARTRSLPLVVRLRPNCDPVRHFPPLMTPVPEPPLYPQTMLDWGWFLQSQTGFVPGARTCGIDGTIVAIVSARTRRIAVDGRFMFGL